MIVLQKMITGIALVKDDLQPCSMPFRLKQFLYVFVFAAVAGGCDSQSSDGGIEIQPNQLSVSMPERIRRVQAINLDTVEAIATVNGQETRLERSGEQFRTSITVPSNSAVNLSIRFRELLDSGGVLDLADFSSTVNVGSQNETLQLFNNDFSDAPFDLDNDCLLYTSPSPRDS